MKDVGKAILRFHDLFLGQTFDLIFRVEDFQVKVVGFDGEEAAKAPARDGHDVDEVGFDGGLGSEVVYKVRAEKVEVLFGFAVEEDGCGGQAVAAARWRRIGPFLRG